MPIEKVSVLVGPVAIRADEVGWHALMLERDTTFEAMTLDDLVAKLQQAVIAHCALCVEMGQEPFTGPSAPDEYRKKFDAASIRLEWLPEPLTTPGISVPELDIRIAA